MPASELPRTTDVDVIAEHLRHAESNGVPRVIFGTYHSAARISEALERTGSSIGLLICDEAHRCTGLASKRDAQPLSDAFLPAARRLFLTATPQLSGTARDAEGELLEVGSMDDTSLFGNVAYRLGYGEAARRSVLAWSPRCAWCFSTSRTRTSG